MSRPGIMVGSAAGPSAATEGPSARRPQALLLVLLHLLWTIPLGKLHSSPLLLLALLVLLLLLLLGPMRFLQRRRAFRCRPGGWVAVIRKLKCVRLCVCGCARVCVCCSLLRRPQSPLLPRHYLRIRFAPRCPPPLPLTVWRAVHFPVLVVVKPPSPRNLLS